MNTFSRRCAGGRFQDRSNQPDRSAHFTTHVSPTIGIRFARLLRAPVFVFGKLVVVLGVVAVIVSGALGVILALADDPPPTQGDWLVTGGIGVGGIVAIVIGRASVRDRRCLVLFLRKFGYSEATTATTYAAERAMGRRWRLPDSAGTVRNPVRRTALTPAPYGHSIWGLGENGFVPNVGYK